MNRTIKKISALVLALVLMMSLVTMAFAAKTSDTQTKSTSEFGTLTGHEVYAGKIGGRKEVSFSTKISKLSSTSINTTLHARVDIHDYLTGVYRDYDVAAVVTNKLNTGYYWAGHSNVVNNNLISAFGTHEARRSGAAAVYTEIYGF